MPEVRWDMLNGLPNAGNALMQGMQYGAQMRQRSEVHNALSAYARNPDDPNAINALTPYDPRTAMVLRKDQETRRTEAKRKAAGSLYAGGDSAGAKAAALESGDFDLAQAFLSLDEAQQKATVAKTRAAAPLAIKASKLPYEERKKLIAAAAPALIAQGWKPEEIQAFDPTDEALEGLAASAMTVEQALDSGKVKWVTGDWGAFATDEMGRPVQPGFAGAPVQAAPQAAGGRATGQWDSFYKGFLAPTEGGYADRDRASGAPVNFGVNQKYNPDINVKDLSQEQAAQILHDRYWVASGADKLPPGLAEVHGDTAVNMGVTAAQRLLQQSGGDPERYLQLREQRYRSIGGPDLRVWLNRNNSLREFIGAQDGAPVAQSGDDLQAQAASGVIRPREKAPPGFREGPGGTLVPIPGGPGDKSAENRVNLRKEAAQVRQEFRALPQVKKFDEVRSQTMQIQALAKGVPDGDPGRAQADMALIFSFMKTLDPNSTVREGEYANAQNAAGVPERIRNFFNAAQNGQKLSPEQRKGMVRAAEDVYRTTARTYNEIARQYHPIFKELGVDNPKSFAPIAVEGDRPDSRQSIPEGWKIERVR